MKKIYSLLAAAILTLGFTACDDVPAPYEVNDEPGSGDQPGEVIVPTGDGTQENPYNTLAANQYVKSLAADVNSENDVYITGIVVSIEEEYNTQYGNGSYTISANGTAANTFKVWRALYLGNKKYEAGQHGVQTGDTVVVCGKVVNFKGNTPETVQGQAYLYSINGSTTEPGGSGEPSTPGVAEGDGTLANPYNAVAATNYTASLPADVNSENDVYIKGKVVSIEEAYGTQYGNGSYTISDDGTNANTFKVWRALYLGNKKYEAGQTALKVGDEVIVCGKVVNFKGNTPETAQGQAYLYSLNGKTESEAGSGSGEGDSGGGGSGSGDVTNPDVDASNGGFENWTGGQPVNWKSTTTATKGAITQSTNARSGKYAAEVAGTTNGNNRLAYTEITLPAGEYTMTFYVKAASDKGGSVRPGYAIVTNGSIAGGSDYKYGDYTNNLTTGEWVLVTHTFSLTAETVINPVVMISKNPGANVIFDDFTLADANGKFYIK